MACRHELNTVNLLRCESSSSRTKFSSGGQMLTKTFGGALERDIFTVFEMNDVRRFSQTKSVEMGKIVPRVERYNRYRYKKIALQVTSYFGTYSSRVAFEYDASTCPLGTWNECSNLKYQYVANGHSGHNKY